MIGKLISQFERQNPGIKIHAVQKPFFPTRAAFTTAVQDGKAPDVFRSDVGWTTLFASKGYLLNIDSYISQRDLSDYMRPLRASHWNMMSIMGTFMACRR